MSGAAKAQFTVGKAVHKNEAVEAVLSELRRSGSAENIAGMARYGIDTANAYGVPLSIIRPLAKKIGTDHELALALWDTGVREARVVAFLVADPARLTRQQMNRWARESGSWDVCDGLAIHLFRKSPLAWERAMRWMRQEPEFLRRSGFALIAALAVHDKAAPDPPFLDVLPLIEAAASDSRNFVKKAVNWALRQIGKRNRTLLDPATALAEKLASAPQASARWIGKDALRAFAKLRRQSG